MHPNVEDRPLNEPYPYPTDWRPYGWQTASAGSHTWNPPPRRAHAPRRRRRLRYLVLTTAAVILALAALGAVNHDHTPAAHHPAASKSPFWTAIVDSEQESSAGHPHANASVAMLKRQGYIALPVFRSRQYASLKPGYWLVAVGRFPPSRQAAATATRLRARGFPGAYPCCLGTAAGCSGHARAQ